MVFRLRAIRTLCATALLLPVILGCQHEPTEHFVTLGPEGGDISGFAFYPDGKRIVTTHQRGWARVWDCESGLLFKTLHDKPLPNGAPYNPTVDRDIVVSVSPDGEKIAISNQNTATVWDAVTFLPKASLIGHSATIRSLDFSPDGKRILTTSMDFTAHMRDDLTARMWDSSSGRQLFSLRAVYARFSPDGERIVTSDAQSKAVQVWDANSGKLLLTLPGFGRDVLLEPSFSPDGGKLMTASTDGRVRLWDSATGKLKYATRQIADRFFSSKFSSDGRLIFVDHALPQGWSILNSATGSPIRTGTARCSDVSADLRFVLSAEQYSGVVLVDTRTDGTLYKSEKKDVESAEFSPDGKHYALKYVGGVIELHDIPKLSQ